MTPRLAALAAALGTLLALLPAGASRSGPFGLDWPEWADWGQELELEDLRHALEIHPPAELERWLHNPRARTERGLQQLAADGPAAALAAFESAGRIAPDDRRVLFNLGTARLVADHGDAVGPLERAVTAAGDGATESDAGTAPAGPPFGPRELQRAWYNLGTARLADGDPAGAVAAFEEALRRDPADAGAKFNLELALRRLQEDHLRLGSPSEAPEGARAGEEAPSDEPGGTEPEPAPEDRRGSAREPTGEGAETDGTPRSGSSVGRRPLAGYEEQSDLTAAQAAALLDAVENLERLQRNLAATRAARSAAAQEEDW